jgi:hypothetical protein
MTTTIELIANLSDASLHAAHAHARTELNTYEAAVTQSVRRRETDKDSELNQAAVMSWTTALITLDDIEREVVKRAAQTVAEALRATGAAPVSERVTASAEGGELRC